MIKIGRAEVSGWEHAIRGARNPMNSWDKSDSCWAIVDGEHDLTRVRYQIGPNDFDLMMRLRNAGPDHRKFMRMITVWVDITAPLYWWKEADTYTVGKTQNSCSTMHKIHDKEFTLDDFSHEHLLPFQKSHLEMTIDMLNVDRAGFIASKDKLHWWQMIQLLPSSYNQKRTVMLNYEVLTNMYHARKDHKLDEWRDMCRWIETLPYSRLITGET